jgi:hypothetical protein
MQLRRRGIAAVLVLFVGGSMLLPLSAGAACRSSGDAPTRGCCPKKERPATIERATGCCCAGNAAKMATGCGCFHAAPKTPSPAAMRAAPAVQRADSATLVFAGGVAPAIVADLLLASREARAQGAGPPKAHPRQTSLRILC